jgi:hypothetical protein
MFIFTFWMSTSPARAAWIDSGARALLDNRLLASAPLCSVLQLSVRGLLVTPPRVPFF